MNSEKMLMELKETQVFWKGVIRGVIGCAVFFVGLITVIYYVVSLLTLAR